MDKESLIEVLSGWNFWRKDVEVGVYRDRYLGRLSDLLKTGQIVAVTGVRRSGKSTLMKQFIKRSIASGGKRTSFLYVNFEEPKFAGMLSLEFLEQIYEAYTEIVNNSQDKPYLFLDEIHNIPGYERFLRGLHEKQEAHIIISGSSSKLLEGELSTLLTGRWIELRIYPLDFPEFLKFKGVEAVNKLDILSQKTKIKKLLREYLEYGGFPLVVLTESKEEILSRYFEDIISRDVGERHRIKDSGKLKTLAKNYLTSFSSPVSYRKSAKSIGISPDTVERFSGYMADALLLFFTPKFSYSLKEQEVNPRKVYGIDTGLINASGFRFTENIGRLYENLVFLSLIRKNKEVYYHKNKTECDFLIKEKQKITSAIQVSYNLKENKEREVKGLLEAMDAYKIREGLIITEDEEGTEKTGNKKIIYSPLWKWLLEE